jgi:hypothetical protein
MQRQGEAFELDFEDEIGHLFPHDIITEVPKGKNGADVVHRVRNNHRDCGTIVWELKNTKSFQRPWIAKVKADARAAKADLAVIVTVALPPEVEATGFGLVDDVWITSPKAWPALATALREQLVKVANVQAAAGGKKGKASLIYDYISGTEFFGRVTALVEAHQGLRKQLDSERIAMQRQWAEREKHLDRLLASTAAVVGDIHGIAGAEVLPVRGLDLGEVGA